MRGGTANESRISNEDENKNTVKLNVVDGERISRARRGRGRIDVPERCRPGNLFIEEMNHFPTTAVLLEILSLCWLLEYEFFKSSLLLFDFTDLWNFDAVQIYICNS